MTSPIQSSILPPPKVDMFIPVEVLEVNAKPVGLAVFSRSVVDVPATLIPFAILQKEGFHLVNGELLHELVVLVTVVGVEMVAEEVVHSHFVASAPLGK